MDGYSVNGQFASADFPDANDVRPTESLFDYGLTNTASPFSLTMNNVLLRHTHELQEKRADMNLTPNMWKRKLHEFILIRMNDIMDFAAKPLAKHGTLGPVEILMRRFARGNFTPNHHSLKDVALDASGVNLVDKINQDIAAIPQTLQGYQEVTRLLYDKLMKAGDEIVHQDTLLQTRLELFDKVQKRVAGLAELHSNDAFPALAEATEAYLQKIFEENELRPAYESLIEAYRLFFTLREMLLVRRSVESYAAEPLCGICFTSPIQYAMSPCGHCFCVNCVKRQPSNCYVCRQTIKDRVKLYIS